MIRFVPELIAAGALRKQQQSSRDSVYNALREQRLFNSILTSSIYLSLLFLLSSLTHQSTVHAQGIHQFGPSSLKNLQQDLEEEYAYLPMEDFHMMSKALGLAPSDLRLRALFHPDAEKELEQQRALKEESAERTSSSESSKRLFAHIKQKGGGTSIITPEEIMAPHIKYMEENKERILQLAIDKLTEGQKAAQEQFTIPPLPKCLHSYTDKTELQPRVKGREKEIIGDFLFVTPKHATTSSKEIFGDSVKLIVYDSSKPSPFGLLAKNYEVSCLPYRVRSTGTFLFKHYGEDALKNFNGDPHGEGEKIL